MPLDSFLDKCRQAMRLRHLSKRTEESYVRNIRCFIEFHGGRWRGRGGVGWSYYVRGA